ncbi:MAG: putative sugar O-methyltransferase [Anaerolineales bacterium]
MGFRSSVKRALRIFLARFGFDIVPRAYIYDWQTENIQQRPSDIFLPEEARSYLSATNPVLLDYQNRYSNCDYPSGEVSLWTEDHVKSEDILYFRGHNAYVFQEGKFNRNLFGYLLAYYYLKSIDHRGLLKILEEDNAFGAITYTVDGIQVSRDLLDSILEIYFLDKHLQLFQNPGFSVLDIGAGYGRSAYRMVKTFPHLKQYYCADAIAVSSFIAEYYLKFRGIEDKARVLHLDTIRQDLSNVTVDLAINVHSFSECTLPAIEWWLGLISENKIPHLMIVPNSGTELLTQDNNDFLPLVTKYGYEPTIIEPKYKDPVVQKYALNPDHFHLFQLR